MHQIPSCDDPICADHPVSSPRAHQIPSGRRWSRISSSDRSPTQGKAPVRGGPESRILRASTTAAGAGRRGSIVVRYECDSSLDHPACVVAALPVPRLSSAAMGRSEWEEHQRDFQEESGVSGEVQPKPPAWDCAQREQVIEQVQLESGGEPVRAREKYDGYNSSSGHRRSCKPGGGRPAVET